MFQRFRLIELERGSSKAAAAASGGIGPDLTTTECDTVTISSSHLHVTWQLASIQVVLVCAIVNVLWFFHHCWFKTHFVLEVTHLTSPRHIHQRAMELYDPRSTASVHTWQPRKIWRIARSVKDAMKADLFTMLNALLARQLSYDSHTGSEKSSYPEQIRSSRKLLDHMRREAEDFCSDTSCQRSLDLRRNIREW